MSLKDHMAKLTSGLDDVESTQSQPVDLRRKRGSGAVPATTSLMHFNDDVKAMDVELRQLKEREGQARMIPLNLIDDSPYQIGELDEERVAGLVANLKENKLNTPITLRSKENGRFETLAGHHRRAAYHVLERTQIESIIKLGITDIEASDLVFYDNLKAPYLSAYDKFEGFARMHERGLKQGEIADLSGIAQQTVSDHLMFAQLPKAAHELIRVHRRKVPTDLAVELGPLVEKHELRVVDAVRRVIENGLSIKAAREFVVNGEGPARPRKPEPRRIKQGKRIYASISVREKKVVVDFADAEEAKALEKQIAELLKARADASARH